MVFFFFFKQKTAYEMRISDWSSDVCSSDLYSREDIAEIKSRIGQIQEMLSVRSEERPVSAEGDPQTMLVEQVSFSLQTRRIRQDHFGRAQLDRKSVV